MPAVMASGDRILNITLSESERLRLLSSAHAMVLKNEDTRCGILEDFYSKYDTVQRSLLLQWTVVQMIFRTLPSRASRTSCTPGGTGRSARPTTTGSTTSGMATTGSASLAILFILPPSEGGSFFLGVPYPTAKHFTDAIERFGKKSIFFVI